nr:aminoglycoside phosphotransferase family protein [Paenisporosarcina quisquiliarum]
MTRNEFRENHHNHSLWDEVVRALLENENIPYQSFSRYSLGGNIVYGVDDQYVLKLFAPFDSPEFTIETEVLTQTDWTKVSIQVPEIVQRGMYDGWKYFLMTRVPGELLIDIWDELSANEKIGVAHDLGLLISQMHQLDISKYRVLENSFESWISLQKENVVKHHASTDLAPHLLEEVQDYIASFLPSSEKVLLTGEYTPFNLLMNKVNGQWKLTGLIDFADCFIGEPEYDLLGPILFSFFKEPGLTSTFLNSYGLTLDNATRLRLMQLLLLHRFSHLPNYMEGVVDMEEVQSLHKLSERFFSSG